MKLFFLTAFLITSSAFAKSASYKLDDPAILGEYKLVKNDKNSELLRAEIVFNTDNQLVVRTDRNDAEYELSPPDENNVVVQYEDEFNCGGEETTCSYDSLTEIKLLSAKNSQGKTIPQLSIEITVTYAWAEGCGGVDEEGNDQEACEDETTTYVLNWSKELSYSIPFYTNIEHPQNLLEVETQCKQQLDGIEYDDATGYLGAYDVCGGLMKSFQFRDDFKTAFSYFLKDWLGGNEKNPAKVDVQLVKDYFSKARELAAQYTGKGKSKITGAMIIEQIDALESVLSKYDTYYHIPPVGDFDNDAKFIGVDAKAKIITIFEIQFKR